MRHACATPRHPGAPVTHASVRQHSRGRGAAVARERGIRRRRARSCTLTRLGANGASTSRAVPPLCDVPLHRIAPRNVCHARSSGYAPARASKQIPQIPADTRRPPHLVCGAPTPDPRVCPQGQEGYASHPEDAAVPEGQDPLEWRLQAAEAIRVQGNELFKAGDWAGAAGKYGQALRYARVRTYGPDNPPQLSEEQQARAAQVRAWFVGDAEGGGEGVEQCPVRSSRPQPPCVCCGRAVVRGNAQPSMDRTCTTRSAAPPSSAPCCPSAARCAAGRGVLHPEPRGVPAQAAGVPAGGRRLQHSARGGRQQRKGALPQGPGAGELRGDAGGPGFSVLRGRFWTRWPFSKAALLLLLLLVVALFRWRSSRWSRARRTCRKHSTCSPGTRASQVRSCSCASAARCPRRRAHSPAAAPPTTRARCCCRRTRAAALEAAKKEIAAQVNREKATYAKMFK